MFVIATRLWYSLLAFLLCVEGVPDGRTRGIAHDRHTYPYNAQLHPSFSILPRVAAPTIEFKHLCALQGHLVPLKKSPVYEALKNI